MLYKDWGTCLSSTVVIIIYKVYSCRRPFIDFGSTLENTSGTKIARMSAAV